MRMKSLLAGASVLVLLGAGAAYAAGFFTPGLPLATGSPTTGNAVTLPLTGNEQIPADTLLSGGANPQSEAITTSQLAAYAGSLGTGAGNFLIGGDASTNLWQRGTTGPSTTTTYLYNADRWFGWSGTGTAMTVSQATTAASLPAGATDSMRMQRTASQTGVVQMCNAQIVPSLWAYALQGQTASLDFWVYTGANFSAASQNMTAYIVTGTSADEGAQKLAFGLNGGGGGSTGWTGEANATAAVIPLTAVSTLSHAAAVGAIPVGAKEIAVALCYTPVGTASTTDALYFSLVQLRKAASLTSFVNTTVGYNLTASPGLSPPGFDFRNPTTEAELQYAFYYLIPEVDTANAVQGPGGIYDTTTTCSIAFALPSPMRAVPTLQGTSAINAYNALSATTFKIAPETTPVVLATPFAAMQTGASTTTTGVVSFKTTAETQYIPCNLVSTAAGGGAFAFNAEE